MITSRSKHSGFTLVELAVVLVIVGILAGSFIGSVSGRIETTRRDNTKNQLQDIKKALFGFAITEGRLPCPTTATAGGLEQPVGGGACSTQSGFIPARTLGLSGAYNRDNLLIDSWGNPFRYSVTAANINAFTTAPGGGGSIREQAAATPAGLAILNPDLVICDSDSAAAGACAGGSNTLIDTAVFIVLSLGKDGSNFITSLAPNSDQGENASEIVMAANAAGENLAYTVGSNNVFVSKSYSEIGSTAGQFDDMIIWASPYTLYSHMLEAGMLP